MNLLKVTDIFREFFTRKLIFQDSSVKSRTDKINFSILQNIFIEMQICIKNEVFKDCSAAAKWQNMKLT